MGVIVDSGMLKQALNIEDVLCLATLVATQTLRADSTLDDSRLYFESVDSDCSNCPFTSVCLACIINQ